MTSSEPAVAKAWITLITGMSGSGKTTAVQALEDQGFFCIDNLPPRLAKQAVDACLYARDRRDRIALVLDARSGHLLEDVPEAIETLRRDGHAVDIVFLDAGDDILIRRFSETRRRHPLDGHSVSESISAERQTLVALRGLSTRVIDTSTLSRQTLRQLIIDGVSASPGGQSLAITCESFGFKYGLPVEADTVFDVRYLQNPFFVPELRALTGLDARVSAFVLRDPEAQEFLRRCNDLLRYLVPLYQREGKRYLTVAIGCTGGKHRSVTVAEALKVVLGSPHMGERIALSVRHRDLERQ